MPSVILLMESRVNLMLPVVMIQETMVINSDIHQINRGFFFHGVKDWLLEKIFVYIHASQGDVNSDSCFQLLEHDWANRES